MSPVRQSVMTLSSEWKDRSLMYPGEWLMTHARMAGTGIWFLIDMRPYKPEKVGPK
ncbi:hypothetical protein ACJ4V0_15950 [Phreatobacter sp. HK31-P]